MDLKSLHLEDVIHFPKNINETIFDKNVIAVFDTEEDVSEVEKLHEQGFFGTRGTSGRLHVYFNHRDDLAPFMVRVFPNYEDDNDKVLTYDLTFYFKRYTFVPLYKYLNEWGRKNRKGNISLPYYFTEWLLDGHISDYDGALETTITTFDDAIKFEMNDETLFMKFLSEISAAFRELATEHGNNKKDSYDKYGYAAILGYKEKDFEGIDYTDLVGAILIPVLTVGLNEGLEEWRKSWNEVEQNHAISIALNQKRKSILFYNGNECKGKAFFEFKLGAIISKCVLLIDNNGLLYSKEVANWFQEAIHGVANIYRSMHVTIKIPEAGNPVLECFE